MHQHQEYETPVKENLSDMMNISVVVKENGDFWLLHDGQFQEKPDYVEYDPERKSLTIVTDMGNLHAVDLDLSPRAYERLKKAQTVFLMHMEDQEKLNEIVALQVIVNHYY